MSQTVLKVCMSTVTQAGLALYEACCWRKIIQEETKNRIKTLGCPQKDSVQLVVAPNALQSRHWTKGEERTHTHTQFYLGHLEHGAELQALPLMLRPALSWHLKL